MSADVGEGLGAAAGSGIEQGADGGELGTGDGGLGVKGCGAASLHETQPRHGRDGGIGPVVVRHIGIGVTGKKIAIPDAVFQQTEEDGGGFRTGDQAVRFHQTILIADDISKMVGVIQHIGRRTAVVSHRFGFSDGSALACVEIVFRDLMLRAIQYIAFGSGDLDIVPVAAIAGNAVHAEQSNAAFRAVPGCLRCCSVDCFAIAAVLVQCKSSAVQCMAVLRIDLFNGEIVGIFAVIAARLNRVYRFRIAHTLKVRNIVGRLPNPILRLPRGKGRAVTELIVRLAVPTNEPVTAFGGSSRAGGRFGRHRLYGLAFGADRSHRRIRRIIEQRDAFLLPHGVELCILYDVHNLLVVVGDWAAFRSCPAQEAVAGADKGIGRECLALSMDKGLRFHFSGGVCRIGIKSHLIFFLHKAGNIGCRLIQAVGIRLRLKLQSVSDLRSVQIPAVKLPALCGCGGRTYECAGLRIAGFLYIAG